MASKWHKLRMKAKKEENPNTVEELQSSSDSNEEGNDEPIRKAYNIFYDNDAKTFFQDTVEYQGDKMLSVVRKELQNHAALAMMESKKIFTDKIILKKEGV